MNKKAMTWDLGNNKFNPETDEEKVQNSNVVHVKSKTALVQIPKGQWGI